MYHHYSIHLDLNESFLIVLFQRIFRCNDDIYHNYTKSAQKKNIVRVAEWLSLNPISPQKPQKKKKLEIRFKASVFFFLFSQLLHKNIIYFFYRYIKTRQTRISVRNRSRAYVPVSRRSPSLAFCIVRLSIFQYTKSKKIQFSNKKIHFRAIMRLIFLIY